jgi:hypothetical protein
LITLIAQFNQKPENKIHWPLPPVPTQNQFVTASSTTLYRLNRLISALSAAN